MAGDVQLTALQLSAAPLDYVVPGSALIRVKSIRAEFTDNAAASAWLPAVQLISDSGHIIATASDQNASVAAGGAADASFFPGVKPAAAAVTAGSVVPFAQMHTSGAGVTIASSAIETYVSIHDTGGTAKFETSDATIFTNGSSTLFTGSAVFGIQINTAGTYRIINNSFVLSGGTAGRNVIGYWAASNGSAPSQFQSGRTGNTNIETWDNQQAGQGPHLFTEEWFSVAAGQVGAVLVRYGRVASGGNIVMSFQMIVEQINTYVATKL